eukprot:2574581-Ditylum_brightwellii.AAC.1
MSSLNNDAKQHSTIATPREVDTGNFSTLTQDVGLIIGEKHYTAENDNDIPVNPGPEYADSIPLLSLDPLLRAPP